MLQFKLDSLDGLDPETRALYRPSGDKFLLDIEPECAGDVIDLRTQHADLLGQLAALRKVRAQPPPNVQAAQAELVTATAELETARRETDALVTAAAAEAQARMEARAAHQHTTIRKLLIDNAARELSGKLAKPGSEGLLDPHVTSRLDVEERDGELVVTARDANGGTVPISSLEESFRQDSRFAPIVRGVTDSEKTEHARRVAETLAARGGTLKADRRLH